MAVRGMMFCFGLAAVVLALMLTGCAHVPYSGADYAALSFAVCGSAADVWTTERALDNGGYECNPLFGSDPSDGKLIAGKVVMVAVLALIGEVYPESRQWLFWLAGGVGFNAAMWNYQEVDQ